MANQLLSADIRYRAITYLAKEIEATIQNIHSSRLYFGVHLCPEKGGMVSTLFIFSLFNPTGQSLNLLIYCNGCKLLRNGAMEETNERTVGGKQNRKTYKKNKTI